MRTVYDLPPSGAPAPACPDPTASGELGPDAFARVARLVEQRAGIRTPDSRRIMLETNLRRRQRAAGFPTLDAYLTHVFDQGGLAAEAVHLIDAATVNKTDFFREPRHFDILAHEVLPALRAAGVDHLRAWSAACSTGLEPYSIAMVLEDALERGAGPQYEVLATDICTHALAAAQHGVYDAVLAEPIPQALRRKYVMVANDGAPIIRVAPALRARTAFARLNLMDPVYPIGAPVHVIFCRNVLIYFDHATQARVLRRLAERLAPGGYLFIGHSETMAGGDLKLERIDHTVFRR